MQCFPCVSLSYSSQQHEQVGAIRPHFMDDKTEAQRGLRSHAYQASKSGLEPRQPCSGPPCPITGHCRRLMVCFPRTIACLDITTRSGRDDLYGHFTDAETEVQTGSVSCPRSCFSLPSRELRLPWEKPGTPHRPTVPDPSLPARHGGPRRH